MKRTVYNPNNTGHKTGKNPIFLGMFLGLHDTINIAYPALEELYLLQRSLGWTEDEVNLEQSRLDMMEIGKGGKTRPEEVEILTKVVSYLWEADSIASRSVISIFSPFLSNSEATAMFTEQTRFEVIHAKTYSEIVRQCSINVDTLIEETLTDQNILARTDIIVEAFDTLIKKGSLYSLGNEFLRSNGITEFTKREMMESLLKGLMALYLLERVQFMSSFAVVFGLAEHDKFKGIADLVKLICRDELCLSNDHQVLTENGWVDIDKLPEESTVAQWDYDSREIKFVKPLKYISKKYTGNMHHITSGKSRSVDQYVTEDHRFPLVNADNSGRKRKPEVTAKELYGNSKHLPLTGWKKSDKKELTDKERFLIAFQADGCMRTDKIHGTGDDEYHPIQFIFNRDRKIESFKSLIERTGYTYTQSVTNEGYNKFVVKIPIKELGYTNDDLKSFSWIDITEISSEWGEEFIEELLKWDGHDRGTSITYSNNNREAIDKVQTICHLSGYTTTVITTEAHVRESQGVTINAQEHYRLSIFQRPKVANGQSLVNETTYVEDMDVYCLTVPSSFFMVRRNGVVSVTGNCHAKMISTVINILKDDAEWLEVYDDLQPTFLKMVDEVVQREFSWNEYLFSEGRSMVGLNAGLLNEWVLYSTKDLCDKINLPYQHEVIKSNPILWVDGWIEFDKVQNANQEADNINYRLNATVDDVDDDEIFEL